MQDGQFGERYNENARRNCVNCINHEVNILKTSMHELIVAQKTFIYLLESET